jgi:hypothetical protein
VRSSLGRLAVGLPEIFEDRLTYPGDVGDQRAVGWVPLGGLPLLFRGLSDLLLQVVLEDLVESRIVV